MTFKPTATIAVTMDGAEVDPFTILLEEKENAIADLCIAAEAKELLNVRDCIRKYDPSRDMEIIESDMKSCSKTLVVETLEFLGCPGMADYYKDHCDNKLICRIQNFMPDNCGICQERFCHKIDGPKPLLECVMCGQGCHTKCALDALAMTADDIKDLSKEETDKILNPYMKLGVIYMCHACQTLELPSVIEGLTEDGARKRHMPHCSKSKRRKSRKSLEPPSPRRTVTFSTEVTNTDHTSQKTPNQALQGALNAESTVDDHSVSGTAENPFIIVEDIFGTAENPVIIRDDNAGTDPSEVPPKPVCRYYKRGTCKHGANGRKDGICPYRHPKYCKNFVMYGNRSPRGCKKGESCNAFHPKLCSNSLNDGVCYNTFCKHRHLKNTRRELQIDVSDSNTIHNNHNNHNKYNTAPPDIRDVFVAPTRGFKQTMFKQNDMSEKPDHYFLDVLKQFKEEMIATVDLKLKEMMKTDQSPPLPVRQPVHQQVHQPVHQPVQQQVHQQVHQPIQPYQAYQNQHPNPHSVHFNNQQPLLTQTRLAQQHPHQIHPTQHL